MQIEITGETEKMILSALTSGEYASVDEFLAVILRQATEKERRDEKEVDFQQVIPQMPERINIEELAASQGVGPVEDFRKLQADFWPAEESVNDFLNAVRAHREQGPVRAN